MTPQQFINKWKPVALNERQAAQTHFNDLCLLFGHPDPISADPSGASFGFERGVGKAGGGDGFADVWKKGFFGWEYKKRRRNLDEALKQLSLYASELDNPPIHVACDTDRFKIVTAFTDTVKRVWEIELEQLVDPDKFAILHAVFHDPESLRPTISRQALTAKIARQFATLALRLQGQGTPDQIAHFINQLVFCFFANSVKLLPEALLRRLLERARVKPARAQAMFDELFAAMEMPGGEIGFIEVAHFNGGLFDGRRALPLDADSIEILWRCLREREGKTVREIDVDWSSIDPTIFGTLFERFLDPAKRKQIGAHYTDAGKIMQIIEPVVLRRLRAEWDAARARIEDLLAGRVRPGEVDLSQGGLARAGTRKRRMTPIEAAEAERDRFIERLKAVRILDPACGSGNFLYLALQGVKDIERAANLACETLGLAPRASEVGPEILLGLELNPLAAELARTTIWIGDIQWGMRNALYTRPQPILRKLDAIECRDALLEPDGQGGWREAEWPAAEFIVGNPPFLGGKLLRRQLGDEAVETLFSVYDGRVPREADLVTYWFEKARAEIAAGHTRRAGLVSTNSIRAGQTAACWSGSRPMRRLSRPGRTNRGWSMARR